MSWMLTPAAWAGETRATVEAADRAATVSAASRADFLLGNGIPPGTNVGAGTRVKVERWEPRPVGGGDARRNYSEQMSAGFLRASISCLVRPVVKVSAMYGPGRGHEPGGIGGYPS